MRDYLNARGMASQERAWLEPPCPKPVQCDWCGCEVLVEDAILTADTWGDEYVMCSGVCVDEWRDEWEQD